MINANAGKPHGETMPSIFDTIESLKTDFPFDILPFACPHDETGYLLCDFKDHFNTLHAVARAISPSTILGCNIQFGYAAAALLTAVPNAIYSTVTAPHTPDHATSWAAALVKSFTAEVMEKEGYTLSCKSYDLIDVNGTGDGDYLFETLDRYACRCRWFAVSLEHATPQDSMALALWTRKYRNIVRRASFLPTMKGLWLFEMKFPDKESSNTEEADYKGLEQYYTSEYFLTDCGGYPQFRKFQGKELAEPRLMTIYNLVAPKPGMCILDVGCGRGELAFALAQAGAKVHAIDYSADAANLAKSTYGALDICKDGRLVFEHQDLFTAGFDCRFDAIIAADFIEHIDSKLEEAAVGKLRGFLKPGGRLIIHTAPNLLNYRYEYKKRRHLAQQAGSYLPPNPRTFYEQVVHINEQTPARLKRLMKRSFPSNVTWVASDPCPLGTLLDKRRDGILIQGLSIFSIASDMQLKEQDIFDRLLPQQTQCLGTEQTRVAAQAKAVAEDNSLYGKLRGMISKHLKWLFEEEQRNDKR